jgi:hypothetical protein
VFPITVNHNGKAFTVDGVFKSMSVLQLKSLIIYNLGLQKSPESVKVINKGKVLKDKDTAEQSLVISGGRLTLMGHSY